ncbi:MAG TPA: carboxypeptidase regulatory-like domain-containing protein [Vicinamibacterales bacterium]|nr:carboxypeptidase regulatory-like domain-containing protein [Vicinamibacterales bacterium]
MSIAFACGGGGQSESQKAASPAAAPNAKKVDQATAGRISGKVLVDGTLPPNPVIKMASDPVCLHANPNGLTDQSYVTSNGGLENVFVYIKDGLGQEYVFETPTSPVTLDQKGCTYHPHVLGVRVGQPVQIVNSDDTLHNVHAMPETNQEFNYGQPINGMKSTVTFTQPEVMIPIKCDVHNWMHAYIGVVSHPYFAVTGDGGTFDLRDVPPGTYTIEAWHEKLGTLTQTVTLGPKDQKQVTFTFKASAASGN